jgi:GAF domain-containing protein
LSDLNNEQHAERQEMKERLSNWLKPTATDPEIAQRQYLLNAVLLSLAVSGLLFGLVTGIFWLLDRVPLTGMLAGLVVQPFYLLSYLLNRRDRFRIAAAISIIAVFLVMALSTLHVGIGHVTIIGLAMVVAISGILMGLGSAITFLALSVITYVGAGMAQAAGLLSAAIVPDAAVVVDTIGLGIGLFVLLILNRITSQELSNALTRERDLTDQLQIRSHDLEEEIQQRTQSLQIRALQLQTSVDIAKLSSEMSTPEELMSRVVELIPERFHYYHASIFLIDETGIWAQLVAGTGEIGNRMLSHRHRLAVGSASIIGWVIANRQPRIVLNVHDDPFYFKNPLLPETLSEMAFPLIFEDRLLGALDIQSDELNAFSEEDIHTMEAIAAELAIAIDSSQAKRVMMQQLARIDQAQRGQTRDAWGRLIASGIPGYIHVDANGIEDHPQEKQGFTLLDEASEKADTVVASSGRELAVPIIVRGEVVATIGARRADDVGEWSSDDIALMEAVAGQAALSLENARQRADEQRRVAELEVLNRVSQAVSQMLRLDSLYRVMHSQVNQVFGDTNLSIALYDPANDQVSFPYASIDGEITTLPTYSLGEDLSSIVIRTRSPLMLLEDAENRAVENEAMLSGEMPKSWLGVPMMVGDAIIGMISVHDKEHEHRYSEDDAALLTTLASQIAAAIQNSRLLDQIQRSERRERLVREITSKVRKSPDMKTILSTTARELGIALRAARSAARIGSPTPDISEDEPSLQANEGTTHQSETTREEDDV